MPVLAAGTIILNGVTYKLADADVFERSIDQFPGKLVIGDRRLRDQSLASEWVFVGDLTDGAGIRYMDPAIHQRRFLRGQNIETRWKNRIVLSTPRTALTTNVPTDAPVWMGHWVGADVVVMVTPTKIRTHIGSGDWVIPTAPASGTIGSGVSGCEYKSNFFVATTDSYWYSSDAGDNWTQTGFAGDDARFFCVFDQKLVKIDASGNIAWATQDPPTLAAHWTAKTSTLSNHTINGMIVWRDLDGAPAIIIATTRGLYIFDFDSDRLYEMPPHWDYGDTYHAWQMRVWNTDLVVTDNRSVLRLTDDGLVNIGPDKDDGLDVSNGRIRWLLPLQNYLLAAIDTGGVTTRTSSIWAYNGRGWHPIATATATNADITTLAFRNNVLFFNQAALSRYLNFADSSEHPLDIGGQNFIAGSVTNAYVQTSDFDGGLSNIDKNSLAAVAEVLNIVQSTTPDGVAIYYAINGSTTFNQLGSTITANGQTIINFGTGAIGETVRSISFRTGLRQGTGAGSSALPLQTPIVVSVKLRYMEVPSQLYAYTFAVDLRGGQGNTALQQRANLVTAKNAQTLVVLQLGQPTQSITGRISQIQGVRNDKNERAPGVYNVTFLQPV